MKSKRKTHKQFMSFDWELVLYSIVFVLSLVGLVSSTFYLFQ